LTFLKKKVYAMLMLETIREELSAKIAFVFFLLFTLWFTFFHLPGVDPGSQYDWFTVTYGIMAALGGIWGLSIAKKWGWVHSLMGKSILLFSLGLVLQEIGQLSYTYYIYYLHIEVPYPSWGDLAFYGSIPCYIFAVAYLARASGIHISLKSFGSKLQAVLIPIATLLLSYIVFLQGYIFDWSNPLKIFIDFGVPFGQAIYISLAILTYVLTKRILGGIMRNKVLFLLFALLVQYIADWTFLYQASRGTWSVSGTNDYMFFCAYFLMTLGLLQLSTARKKLKK
jgi:hypothetical protein